MIPVVIGILQRLWAMHHGIEVLSSEMTRRLGVSGPQRLALRLLSLEDGMTPGALSRALVLHPSSLTGMLRRMEGHHLILRERDPQDGRRQRLHVTDSGARLAALDTGTVEAALQRTLDGVDDADVVAITRWLNRFARELVAEVDRLAATAPRR